MKRRPRAWLVDLLVLCVLGGLAYAFGQVLSAGDWLAAVVLFAVLAMCLVPLIVLALFDE